MRGENSGQRCVEVVVSYDYGEEMVILRVFSGSHVNKVEITFFSIMLPHPVTTECCKSIKAFLFRWCGHTDVKITKKRAQMRVNEKCFA